VAARKLRAGRGGLHRRQGREEGDPDRERKKWNLGPGRVLTYALVWGGSNLGPRRCYSGALTTLLKPLSLIITLYYIGCLKSPLNSPVLDCCCNISSESR
jgi:hypothetical protein